MAHKSKVCAILFDVSASSYAEASKFWADALGRELDFDPGKKYTVLKGETAFLIQKANSGSEGVHIDIETDDVEAEVTRLEKLGATRREKVQDWWVMVSPGNHPYCVVPVQSKDWPKGANEWD